MDPWSWPKTMTRSSSSSSAIGSQSDAFFLPVESAFGRLHMVWRDAPRGPEVTYISFPDEAWPTARDPQGVPNPAAEGSCPEIDRLANDVRRCLAGESIHFSLEFVALDTCGDLQTEVLLAEYAIPRGAVSTYGRVARTTGRPSAARAVGQALARNPFPLVIPCHRAVRSTGHLGGYRGGLDMKRALLRFEGVEVDSQDRVLVDQYYY